MQNPEFNTREYFNKIYSRPVILEAKQLTQKFSHGKTERTVLNALDLKIHKREFICVIGPSGCGKSTFSRVVAGLDPYSSGEILVDGQPITGPSPERGMVFQGYTLFPWKTVKENVMFGPKMKGQSNASAEAQAREWINIIGLEKYQDQYPHQLMDQYHWSGKISGPVSASAFWWDETACRNCPCAGQ